MRVLWVIIVIFFATSVNAATIYVADYGDGTCSNTNVTSAITAATSGDTVVVPAGSCTWTGEVTLPVGKTITLLGAGYTSTIITSSHVFIRSYSANSRISGFRFNLTADTDIMIEVRNTGFRVDHNYFDNQSGQSIEAVMADGNDVTYAPSGLIDNNTFIECRVTAYGFGTLVKMNGVWDDPNNFGTADGWVYVEDNVITRTGGTNAMDSNGAGKYVFRYNTVSGISIMAHSLQGAATRGPKAWEAYGNTFTFQNSGQGEVVGFMRAGTGHFFNNYTTGPASSYLIKFDNVRSIDEGSTCCGSNPPPATNDSGACDGTSLWDGNTAGQSGWPCRDQIGRGPDTGTDSSVIGKGTSSEPVHLWNNYRSTGVVVPVYVVDNTRNQTHIQADRDFYDYDTTFDGTSGTGCGTLANMPATCTAGVGYWATTQSCTDMTGMVGANPSTPISGTLYKCTATDTWTASYTPYTYPHPLRGGMRYAVRAVTNE